MPPTPYERMIAKGDQSPRKLGLAWALKVETLYKFKGFSGEQRDHVVDMLENSRLFFSNADQFNDPFDVAPVFALGGDPKDPEFFAELEAKELAMLRAKEMSEGDIESYRKLKGTDIDSLAASARDEVRTAIRGATRIFCLSSEQSHPLQWAHYADRHHGLCLHFDSGPSSPIGLARKVSYSPNREPILLPTDRQSPSEIFDRFVLVKADFWSYEHEFRIVAAAGVDWGAELKGPYVEFDPDRLTGITFGMRMPSKDEADLLGLVDAHHPGIPVWKATENYERFWMKIERLR